MMPSSCRSISASVLAPRLELEAEEREREDARCGCGRAGRTSRRRAARGRRPERLVSLESLSLDRQRERKRTPNGVSHPVRRLTGASRRRKHRCWISAESSLATLPDCGASWTMIHRPVLLTLLTTVSICGRTSSAERSAVGRRRRREADARRRGRWCAGR